jgi:hypothetical protein
MHAMDLFSYEAKVANLKLESQLKQLSKAYLAF